MKNVMSAVANGSTTIAITTLALAALDAIVPSLAHAGGLEILQGIWESCTVTVSCSGGGQAK